MGSSNASLRSVAVYCVLVFALSVPLWVVGVVAPVELMPGLALSTLNVFCPAIAASILVYREGGAGAVSRLLKRSFDLGRHDARVWYVPTVLLNPAIAVLAYGVIRLTRSPVPAATFPGVAALLMLLASFVAGLGEELGWAYAIDKLQGRWDALPASLLLGVVWAMWHLVPLVQAQHAPVWIAWWFLSTVALRVLIVWLYNNTGKSVFAAALFHALSNVSTLLLPEYYDPSISGLITALAAVVVALVWGPRTLTRTRRD